MDLSGDADVSIKEEKKNEIEFTNVLNHIKQEDMLVPDEDGLNHIKQEEYMLVPDEDGLNHIKQEMLVPDEGDGLQEGLSSIEGVSNLQQNQQNPFLRGSVSGRREREARAKRVEAQIKHNKAIHSIARIETKYKSLAAQEMFKEKLLLIEKAEIEVTIKILELDKLLARGMSNKKLLQMKKAEIDLYLKKLELKKLLKNKLTQ
nr:uncharacterized protein LOC106681056 isoform X3 [Halyomorpha halys]